MSTQSVDINISCSCLCVNLLSFILLSVSVCMHGIQYLQYRRYLPFCLILAAIFSTETLTIVARCKCKCCAKKGQNLDKLFLFYAPNPMIGNDHVPCCIAVSDFRFPFSDAPTSQSRLSQELDSPRTRCRIGTT